MDNMLRDIVNKNMLSRQLSVIGRHVRWRPVVACDRLRACAGVAMEQLRAGTIE